MNENNNSRKSASTIWFLVCLVGMVVFAILWLVGPKEIVREVEKKTPFEVIVTNAITNIVEKPIEVEKLVERRVEVPAQIPDDYLMAMKFARLFVSAPLATNDETLMWNIKAVNPSAYVNPAVQSVVSEDEIKTKFEITLRKYGIPISSDSRIWLRIAVEGLWDENTRITLTYSINTSLSEVVTVFRNDEAKRIVSDTWSSGSYGFAGRTVAKDAILKAVEAKAESFANKYLAANPNK